MSDLFENDEPNPLALIVVGVLVLVLAVVFFFPVDSKGAVKTLENLGYTDVETTGYAWFSCDKNDWYQTGFKAVSPNGRKISGVVCRGMFFKASTVRFD